MDLRVAALVLVELVPLVPACESPAARPQPVLAHGQVVGGRLLRLLRQQRLAHLRRRLHAHLLDVRADEVGVVDVDEVQLHRQQLPHQVDRLLRLPTPHAAAPRARVDHALHAVLQSLLEERAGSEDGQLDLLLVPAQLVLHQLHALLATPHRTRTNAPVRVEGQNPLLAQIDERLVRREQSAAHALLVRDVVQDLYASPRPATATLLRHLAHILQLLHLLAEHFYASPYRATPTVEDVANAPAALHLLHGVGAVAVQQQRELAGELTEPLEEGHLHLRERAQPHRHGLQVLPTPHARGKKSQLLRLELVDLGDDVGQAHLDVLQQQPVQLLAQVPRPVHLGNACVVRAHEPVLVAPLHLHVLARLDVLLPAIDHAHVAQAQRNQLVRQDLVRVRALVHQVQLRDHAHRAQALRVHLARHLDRVAVRQVSVGRSDCHDNAVRLANELQHHATDDHLDVLRLVAHRHARDARQIDQCQVDHVRAEHLQDDGALRHADARARLADRLRLDLIANLVKVVVLPALLVQEHTVVYTSLEGKSSTVRHRIVVDQLQNQRTTGHDAAAAGKEVLAHDVLQYAALAAGLPAHHRDLRHVQHVVADDGEHLLDLVHDPDQALQTALARFAGLRSRLRGRRNGLRVLLVGMALVVVHHVVLVAVRRPLVARRTVGSAAPENHRIRGVVVARRSTLARVGRESALRIGPRGRTARGSRARHILL